MSREEGDAWLGEDDTNHDLGVAAHLDADTVVELMEGVKHQRVERQLESDQE